MNSIKEVIGRAQARVDSKINTLSDKMDVQTTEYTALKEDLRALQHKVSDMEKRDAEVKLKEDRKGLEDAVLCELREEEARIVVTGYALSEADNNPVNKLVKDTLRDCV